MLQRGAQICSHQVGLLSGSTKAVRLFRNFVKEGNQRPEGDLDTELERKLKNDLLNPNQKLGVDLEAEALREEFLKQRRDAQEPFKIQARNDRNKPLLNDRPTKLNLKQFEVLSPADANPKDDLNRPKGVMEFIDQRTALKNGNIVVKGVFPDAFNISNIIIFGGVLLFNNQLFSWDVTQGNDIRAHHFDILEVIKPSPAYIVVGTGETKQQLSPEIMERLYSFNARVDVVDTFRAVSTFNICSGDSMNVVAFLVPGTQSNTVTDDFESGAPEPRSLRL
jgi:NADH dehydrogenase [ubiquinone] 1 alpha subcomplex assembly factor 3